MGWVRTFMTIAVPGSDFTVANGISNSVVSASRKPLTSILRALASHPREPNPTTHEETPWLM
jgi:hypothetical protein